MNRARDPFRASSRLRRARSTTLEAIRTVCGSRSTAVQARPLSEQHLPRRRRSGESVHDPQETFVVDIVSAASGQGNALPPLSRRLEMALIALPGEEQEDEL
jgi:hypothetical protein